MRKHISALTLAVCGGFLAFAAQAQITGTSSLTATFQTNVVPGTCTAEIQDSTGNPSSEISFGDVFKSDLTAKSRIESLKLNFSDCSGVKSAEVQVAPGAGSNCSTASSDKFGSTNGTAFELWKGAADSGSVLSCTTQPKQNVTISSGNGNLDMNARIVIADGKTIADVTPGAVTSLVTFMVTYQ
ncbi:TPA: fimbrial protein [Enterobacter cancerogenus]|uniref:fimbrial protein n=1 Tax=Enterobacter sp. TaxID=42895 RepID=UPI0032FE5CAD|nr:fimbrial protein [Enterobacter cancerogenus]HDR2165089.1 fimbrial protein [Enterobacter cancerogenus]HDR2267723.1 fimbrial protein [Enterobacter cancerogenus]